ncbi:LCP family protein [Candidatus Frankia nodulisporulans]|uniref:LCP family protein n=1 Tax=Candidatus Frankia nodulisporulans TaxID=2060052 RepID=UPI0013D593EE|nr:LCP family protein [Candidatus Frankia nodulisporulans]
MPDARPGSRTAPTHALRSPVRGRDTTGWETPRRSRRPLPPHLDPRRPRRYRPFSQRLLLAACATLSTLVLAVTSLGWVAYRHFDSAVTREDWKIAGTRPVAAAGAENILLLGDDSRDGTDGEYGTVDGVRSDTTIIAHLGPDGSATLLSFPRDMLVPVLPKAKANARDGHAKLTEVLQLAGVPGLVTTLESLTNLKIDHTISINLAGFRAMTDAVGGVTVCVTPLPDGSTRNLHDAMSGWSGRLGENRLDGRGALAFVRTRYALGDERLRILRQQQFLDRLLTAATSAGVLTNPAKISALLGAVGGALRVDSGLDQAALLSLARRASEAGSGGMRFLTVPTHIALPADGAVDDHGTVPPHGAVLIADQAGLNRMLTPLLPDGVSPPNTPSTGGTTTAGAGGSATTPVGSPSSVSIAAVRNATSRTGLAARTVDGLRALGFTGPMTTSTTTGQAQTEIYYPPRLREQASVLASRIPGSQLVATSPPTPLPPTTSAPGESSTSGRTTAGTGSSAGTDGIVLAVGTDFSGLVSASNTPTSTASSTGGGGGVTAGAPTDPASAISGVSSAAAGTPANTSCTP